MKCVIPGRGIRGRNLGYALSWNYKPFFPSFLYQLLVKRYFAWPNLEMSSSWKERIMGYAIAALKYVKYLCNLNHVSFSFFFFLFFLSFFTASPKNCE